VLPETLKSMSFLQLRTPGDHIKSQRMEPHLVLVGRGHMDREIVIELLVDASLALAVRGEILEIEGRIGIHDHAVEIRTDLFNISGTYGSSPETNFHIA